MIGALKIRNRHQTQNPCYHFDNRGFYLEARVGVTPHSLADASSFVAHNLRPTCPRQVVRRSLRYSPAGEYLTRFKFVRLPYLKYPNKKYSLGVFFIWRLEWESNPRMAVLQTAALDHFAIKPNRFPTFEF